MGAEIISAPTILLIIRPITIGISTIFWNITFCYKTLRQTVILYKMKGVRFNA